MKHNNFTRILINNNAPIDFYIADNKDNNYNDTWEKSSMV